MTEQVNARGERAFMKLLTGATPATLKQYHRLLEGAKKSLVRPNGPITVCTAITEAARTLALDSLPDHGAVSALLVVIERSLDGHALLSSWLVRRAGVPAAEVSVDARAHRETWEEWDAKLTQILARRRAYRVAWVEEMIAQVEHEQETRK